MLQSADANNARGFLSTLRVSEVLPSWRVADCSLTAQNAEIFTLTYGSMVRQLLADTEDVEAVNKQLDAM